MGHGVETERQGTVGADRTADDGVDGVEAHRRYVLLVDLSQPVFNFELFYYS